MFFLLPPLRRLRSVPNNHTAKEFGLEELLPTTLLLTTAGAAAAAALAPPEGRRGRTRR